MSQISGQKKEQSKILAKKVVFTNQWRTLEEWKIRQRDGLVGDFYIQIGGDIVTIFGITDDDQVLTIREYYTSLEQVIISLVGGYVGANDVLLAAKNELREEAGCEANEWIYLGNALISKYQTGRNHFYLATGVHVVGPQQLEPAEDIEVEFISKQDFTDLLASGQLHGLSEVACAYRALEHLDKI
jgi:8-oxo-dGTP pyrophosphatase MutT (NUDIX family)